MSTYDDGANKPHDESIDTRAVRALTEKMTVLPHGGDIYDVVSHSGSSYRVDAREGRCTCADHKYREARCKHIRRVAYATGETPIPEWCDVDAVDPLLGEHVDGPCVAASDGGMTVETGDDVDGDGDDDGDDGCLCDDTDLGCFDHFEVDDDVNGDETGGE